MKTEHKPIIYGTIAGLSLIAFYFLVVSLAESFSHALEEFFSYYLFLIPIAAGFGIQVGLHIFIRNAFRATSAAKTVAATGSMSTASMVACCAHHLTDFLPFLGIAAAAALLAKYQAFFMGIGFFSNLLGILFLLETIKTHNIYGKNGSLLFVKKYDMKMLQKAAFIIGAAVSILLIFYPSPQKFSGNLNLETQTREIGIVIFQATPAISGDELDISLSIDTHSGSLDFDPAQVSRIIDDNKRTLLPRAWEGSPPGGHHRKGILRFPLPDGGFTLLIQLEGETVTFQWGEK